MKPRPLPPRHKRPKVQARPQAAVIMAAGKGTRMRSQMSKVLHQVAGEPMIARVVRATLEAGIERVVIVIGHQAEEVRASVEARFPNADLRWAIQAEQKGTAHAVMCAEEGLSGFSGDVWILSGDVPNLSSYLLKHIQEDHPYQSLVVTGMLLEQPKMYGRLLFDESGLYAIREARDCSPEELKVNAVNAGLYRVDAELLFAGLRTIKTDNAQGEYYLTDLVAYVNARGDEIGCPLLSDAAAEELEGVNDRLDLARAEERAQAQLADEMMRSGVTLLRPASVRLEASVQVDEDVLIEEDVSLLGDTKIERGVVIERGARVSNSHVAAGAVIHAYSHLEGARVGPDAHVGPFARLREGAVLEGKVKVGNFVEVKKTTLEEGAKASHLSYLGDARIGRGANIGAGTITCNYDGYQKYPTEIGAGAFIGSDTQLVAPVKVGEGAFVAAGTTVTRDVPAHSLALTRPETTHRPEWAARFHAERSKAK